MEGNSEPTLDEFGHTSRGPEIGGTTLSGRFLGQPLANLLILLGGEETGSPRRGLGREARFAIDAMFGHPLGHGDGMHAQSSGHGRLCTSAENELHGSPTHGFQLGSRSFASHELENNDSPAGNQ